MDARVVIGAPVAEETPVAVVTRGVATPSPVPPAPGTAVIGTGNGGGGGGAGSSTAAATLASAPCAPQNPVVVVASPSSNHQQPTGVPVAAVPRILSRNVNGTRKSRLGNCLRSRRANRKRPLLAVITYVRFCAINPAPGIHERYANRSAIKKEFAFKSCLSEFFRVT